MSAGICAENSVRSFILAVGMLGAVAGGIGGVASALSTEADVLPHPWVLADNVAFLGVASAAAGSLVAGGLAGLFFIAIYAGCCLTLCETCVDQSERGLRRCAVSCENCEKEHQRTKERAKLTREAVEVELTLRGGGGGEEEVLGFS